MPRKLKTYRTSIGFFDLAVAAPSMKAALESWGSKQNLFRNGLAAETDDPDIVAATMAQPGVVFKRAVGSKRAFRENAELPKSLPARTAKPAFAAEPKKAEKAKVRAAIEEGGQKAKAIRYETERVRRGRERQNKDVKRKQTEALDEARRLKAVQTAEAIRNRAQERHEEKMAQLEKDRSAIDRKFESERLRWHKEEAELAKRILKAKLQ